MIVNGREYPLWSQFVEKKEKWIGGKLEDWDMGIFSETEIVDIELKPNGDDSAYFRVLGKKFSCGFDVGHGGISGVSEKDWLTFSGYGGHTWRIQEPNTAV